MLKRNETDPFLKRITTDDEKWVVCDNFVGNKSWSKRDEPAQSSSKADIHEKKVMLSVWWDFKGIVYFDLLPRNQTINLNVYCRQLMKLDKEIKEKRPELATRKGVIIHQDNARPNTSLVTRKKLLELGWEVMPHPTFDSNESVRNELIQFFSSKNHNFYESGIMKLTERWQKVIGQNGQYIIDSCLLFVLMNLL